MMLNRTRPAVRVPIIESTVQMARGWLAPWGWCAGAPYRVTASPPPPLCVCVCVCVCVCLCVCMCAGWGGHVCVVATNVLGGMFTLNFFVLVLVR